MNKQKVIITIAPKPTRNEFLREVHFLHTSYVGKNGKAYNRKEKHKNNLTNYI